MPTMKLAHHLSLVYLIICSELLAFVISIDGFPDMFTIETDNGRIRGKLNETVFDKQLYYSFRGIPYGKDPIDELRFKAPVKAEPWTKTFDAFDHGNYCVQVNLINNAEVVGKEDCLNLNVFVPAKSCVDANNNELLPVIFVIAPGAFRLGLASCFGPDFFIDQNVIVVVANYRVGPLGFLSLGLPEYSGNMGLKDQLLALDWVNQNIEAFSGDKNRITLFGHSSGAMSASVHILSPESRKLFQRAIVLSGSAFSPLLPRVGDHKSIVRNLAEVLYYPIQSDDDLIEFLGQINADFFTKYTYQGEYYPGFGRKGALRMWNVIIEEENAINPVLTKSPVELTLINRNPNDIDTLFAYTTREFVYSEDYRDPKLLKIFDEQFETPFPLSMPDFRSDAYKVAAQKIRDFYLDGNAIGSETLSNISQMSSDIRYAYGINLNARIQAAQSNGRTFMSRFSVANEWSYSARLTDLSNGKVLYKDHTDTIHYLFRLSLWPAIFPDSAYSELTANSQPYQIIKNMTTFYADFVKYGNPMPNAEPIEFKSKDSAQYMYFDITNEGIVVKPNLYKIQMDFWDEIVGLHLNQTYDKNNFL